jgi:vitamin B12 transporter
MFPVGGKEIFWMKNCQITEKVTRIFLLTLLCLWVAVPSPSAQSQEAPEQEQAGQAAVQDKNHVSSQQKSAETSAVMDPMVVTATRIETPASQVTKSVSLVTSEDRDDQQQYFLPELLDNEPGVNFRQNGGIGQYSTISIRGVPSTYTQFQYNGFPLRDAADTQSTFSYFTEDIYGGGNLRQIEVLKGPQSTLYGSQAMGGVINILPETWKQGVGGNIRSEFGPNNTFIETSALHYGQDKYYFNFNPTYITTDGEKNGGPNGYYYRNRGFSTGAGYRLTPDMNLEFSSIFADTDLAMSKITPSLDRNGNLITNIADPDKHREGQMAQYGLKLNDDVSTFWNYSIKAAYTETQRHYYESSVDANHSNYDGSTDYLETQHNFNITDWLGLVVGADYEKDYYDGQEPRNPYINDYAPEYYKQNWYSWDMFSQASLKLLDKSLFLNFGGRSNNPEAFDPKTVGEASAAYLFKQTGTKIHGQIGSGYRTPSLYEIYGGYLFNGQLITIGNPNLTPEKSLGYEFGVEQAVFDGIVKLGVNWFHTDFDNLIIYDGVSNKYMNADKGSTEGFETYANAMPLEWLKLDFAYTYADPQYQTAGGQWERQEYMPRNKMSSSLTFFLPYDLTAFLHATWQDAKVVPLYNASYDSVRWNEPSSTTVDAAVTYTFLKHYQIFLRAENLLDEHYTESAYLMPGRSIYGGVKLMF